VGFVSPEQYVVEELRLDIDQRNNIHAVYGDFRTSVEGVFVVGDYRPGQSLVVWAINEGRGLAESCNQYLLQKRSDDISSSAREIRDLCQ
jgi:glutamate synthase (NADPH/NADH) small chain